MTKPLHRITYSSSAYHLFPKGELATLLAGARRKNAQSGVTGMLLYHEGGFFQTLEGPRAAVNTTFSRIMCDARHGNVVIVDSEDTGSRLFADWSMGWTDAADLGDDLQQDLATLRDLICSSTTDPRVRVLMSAFLRGLSNDALAA